MTDRKRLAIYYAALFLGIAALFVIVWQARGWVYSLSQEELVRATICEQVKPEALKEPCP